MTELGLLAPAFGDHWQSLVSSHSLQHQPFLLACSGGLDSMVLADLLLANKVPFALAHMNFQLRGEESLRDENFVRQFAAQHQLPCFVGFPAAPPAGPSVQEWAREQRYQWFLQLLAQATYQDKSFAAVLTAHHADDQCETLLFHFFRGSGWEGLQSMPSYHAANKVLRPLLPFGRQELLAHAQAHQLNFVEDSSNAQTKYVRNQIRLELLPAIEKVFPGIRQTLLRNQQHFDQQFLIYQQAIQHKLQRIIQYRANGDLEIPLAQWRSLQPLETYTWEIIKPYGFLSRQVKECIKLLSAPPGAQLSSASHTITKIKQWMVLSPLASAEQPVLLTAEQGSTHWQDKVLTWRILDLPQAGALPPPGVEWLDADGLSFPLVLRTWRAGDYFYPLGLNKKKKLAKLLGEYKMDALSRSQVKILESGNKIIAALGCRIDHRFRCQPQTQKVLELQFSGTKHSPLPLPKKKTAKDSRSKKQS